MQMNQNSQQIHTICCIIIVISRNWSFPTPWNGQSRPNHCLCRHVGPHPNTDWCRKIILLLSLALWRYPQSTCTWMLLFYPFTTASALRQYPKCFRWCNPTSMGLFWKEHFCALLVARHTFGTLFCMIHGIRVTRRVANALIRSTAYLHRWSTLSCSPGAFSRTQYLLIERIIFRTVCSDCWLWLFCIIIQARERTWPTFIDLLRVYRNFL